MALLLEVLLVEVINEVLLRSVTNIAFNLADVFVESQPLLGPACASCVLRVLPIAACRDTFHAVFLAIVSRSGVRFASVKSVLQQLDVRKSGDEAVVLTS